jgi:hypothetical protein
MTFACVSLFSHEFFGSVGHVRLDPECVAVERWMRTLIWVLLLTGCSYSQQLIALDNAHPREAESILITSCRAVGERLAVPMPSPRVELRLGEGKDAVESEEAAHVIHMRHWNRSLFKRAALMVCMREAEFEIVPQLFDKVREY